MLQKSLWPSILRTDSTSSRTQKRISTFSNASLFLALLTLIASIVTPLGLSDSFRTRRVFTAKFSHVVDTSVFGQGSTARGSYSTSRLCGSMLQQICPGQINTNGLTTSINRDKDGFITEWELDDNDGKGWIDARVPSNITDVFTSAGDRYGESVAGLFDIQYRNYQNLRRNVTKMKVNNGEEYTQGVPRFLTSHVLEDDYILVEGLVLDMKNGGVGFRNHTAPEKAPHGATWVETLLWVKPETVCVCNNLTIDYTVEYEGLSAVRLTDRGGFQDVIDARRKYSVPPKINRDASQENPELYHRAWRGALSENLGQLLARNISYKNVSELPGKAYDMSGDLALTNYDVSWPIGFVTAINSPWTLYLNSLGVIPGEGSGEHLSTFVPFQTCIPARSLKSEVIFV